MSILKVIILALVQGLAELLPVSSSAHVVVAEKLMGLDASSPQMTLLLVMLHTGTMFAVIVYFWKAWREHYFSSAAVFRTVAINVIISTFITSVVGLALQLLIEKVFLKGAEKSEVEVLFARLQRIDGGRRRACHVDGNMVGVVAQAAHAGMCLKHRPVRQVDGMRRDVIDGGLIVIAERSQIRPLAKPKRGHRHLGLHHVGELLKHRALGRLR